MLENILQLIKEAGQTNVVENPEVPNAQNEAVMAEAGEAVAGTIQSALAEGKVDEVMAMFQSNDDDQIMASPMAQNMQSGFLENITSKLGINKNVAIGLAGTLLPMVISQLVKRTNSTAPEDNGFNLNSLIGSLAGGGGNQGGFDIGGLISQFTGGGQQQANTGGGFDIGSLINQISGGAKQQQSGGGLSSLIQGFFGK